MPVHGQFGLLGPSGITVAFSVLKRENLMFTQHYKLSHLHGAKPELITLQTDLLAQALCQANVDVLHSGSKAVLCFLSYVNILALWDVT